MHIVFWRKEMSVEFVNKQIDLFVSRWWKFLIAVPMNTEKYIVISVFIGCTYCLVTKTQRCSSGYIRNCQTHLPIPSIKIVRILIDYNDYFTKTVVIWTSDYYDWIGFDLKKHHTSVGEERASSGALKYLKDLNPKNVW